MEGPPLTNSYAATTTTVFVNNGATGTGAQRDPLNTDAWLVGGGIASLAAAVHLITDAQVPASRIHILEASPTPGGSMAAEDEPKDSDARPGAAGASARPTLPPARKGYVIRAARKLNFSYRCFYDTLSKVPYPCRSKTKAHANGANGSTNGAAAVAVVEAVAEAKAKAKADVEGEPEPEGGASEGHVEPEPEPASKQESEPEQQKHDEEPPKTLLDHIRRNRSSPKERPRTKIRLVSMNENGRPETVDTATMGLNPRDQAALMAFILRSEESLGNATIRDFFELEFFETNFWDMVSTMYLFKPWHSAIELRRYLHRFLHEFPNISTMAGMEYMPSNDFEAAIVPLVAYLREQGVDFQYGKPRGIGCPPETHLVNVNVYYDQGQRLLSLA